MNAALTQVQTRSVPILLYDGGCATCSRIARWVESSATRGPGKPAIVARPVGNDPLELRRLNPGLNIWDAYAVSHVIMPDGSMKLGGEAVAEVLRCLPSTTWATSLFDIRVFGIRPFQTALDLAYRILDDVRPILGCESCGTPKLWVRPMKQLIQWAKTTTSPDSKPSKPLHFRPLPIDQHRTADQLHQPPPPVRR
jgi:predicted DCC family thiol-disulfide oxidoreductase YuxK